MMPAVDGWLRAVQGTIWPPRCVLCGEPGQPPCLDLCNGCDRDMRRNVRSCAICAEPLSADDVPEGKALRCGDCLQRPPRFDAAYCPYRYAYPLDHLVRGLKYHGRVAQGRVLGQMLAREILQWRGTALPQALIPVPLAPRRFRQRGYNQAIELGNCLQRRLDIPLCTDLIERVRETAEQAGLDRRARRRNIRGAFQLRSQPVYRHVAIIDDVVTTGSTVNEVARVLKHAGVERVEVWAVARAAKF